MAGVVLQEILDEWMGLGGGVVQQELPAQVTAVMAEDQLERILAWDASANDPTVVLSRTQILRLLDEERLALLVDLIEKEYNAENSR